MNRNILKIINLFVTFFIIVMLLFSIVISQDECHLEVCHDEHCAYCIVIHFAQNIISLITLFLIAVIIGFLIYFFLSKITKKQEIFVLNSLLFQKVQFNE